MMFNLLKHLVTDSHPVTHFFDSVSNSKILFVEAGPRHLVMDGYEYTVQPVHIICVIGTAGLSLYFELLHYIQVTSWGGMCGCIFANLRTLTLMLPTCYFAKKKQKE